MFVLEANGIDPISIALDSGSQIDIMISEVENGCARIIVCAHEDVLLSVEHLKCDPRELDAQIGSTY